jgi:antitoxin HicB
MKYRVYLEKDEDGMFVASCPTLPGCVSQGQTRVKHGDPVPPGIEEEVVEVSNR